MNPRGEMGGPWWDAHGLGGMGFPGMMGLGIALVLVIVVLLLVLFFRRPARGPLLPSLSPPPGGELAEGGEEELTLVVPDISGYTRFLALNRFAAGHAQRIVSELLGALIEAARPTLSALKIEGDAILFATASGDEEAIGEAVARMLAAFYGRREALHEANLCPCDACERIATLDLKVVVHRGPVLRTRIGGAVELGGMAPIVVHRLLKNSLAMARYVMVTQTAACRLPLACAPVSHVERYDDIGPVPVTVYPFEPEDVLRQQPPAAVDARSRARDLAAKLAANARTLRAGLGLRSASGG